MSFLEISRGSSPVILGLPHTGTELPDNVAKSLNELGLRLVDTDWHIHRLYEGLMPDMSSVRTTIHRYAIDVNRDPSGASLYPGQNTTGLCPLTDFDVNPIYRPGAEPSPEDVEARRIAYHAPCHAALASEIARIKAIHGFAILYDCHSIRSEIPFLFEGTLHDFNIGTNVGAACDEDIERAVLSICESAAGYGCVLNGRFKGGWTTRHHGDPLNGVHAIQMELAQSTYLSAEMPPWDYRQAGADRLRRHLAKILERLNGWRPA